MSRDVLYALSALLQLGLDERAIFVTVRRQVVSLAVTTVRDCSWRIVDASVGIAQSALNFLILALAFAHVELARAPNLDTRGSKHLLAPVRKPSNAARDSEEDGVEAVIIEVSKQVQVSVWQNTHSRGKPMAW